MPPRDMVAGLPRRTGPSSLTGPSWTRATGHGRTLQSFTTLTTYGMPEGRGFCRDTRLRTRSSFVPSSVFRARVRLALLAWRCVQPSAGRAFRARSSCWVSSVLDLPWTAASFALTSLVLGRALLSASRPFCCCRGADGPGTLPGSRTLAATLSRLSGQFNPPAGRRASLSHPFHGAGLRSARQCCRGRTRSNDDGNRSPDVDTLRARTTAAAGAGLPGCSSARPPALDGGAVMPAASSPRPRAGQRALRRGVERKRSGGRERSGGFSRRRSTSRRSRRATSTRTPT